MRWTMTGSDLPERIWKNWGKGGEGHDEGKASTLQSIGVSSDNTSILFYDALSKVIIL